MPPSEPALLLLSCPIHLNTQRALAGAFGKDANGIVAVVAENEVEFGVANSSVLMHGQVTRTARAVGSEAGVDRVIAGVKPDGKEAVIRQLSATLQVPLVAGGLISDKEDAIAALGAGAAAISTSCEPVWFL